MVRRCVRAGRSMRWNTAFATMENEKLTLAWIQEKGWLSGCLRHALETGKNGTTRFQKHLSQHGITPSDCLTISAYIQSQTDHFLIGEGQALNGRYIMTYLFDARSSSFDGTMDRARLTYDRSPIVSSSGRADEVSHRAG